MASSADLRTVGELDTVIVEIVCGGGSFERWSRVAPMSEIGCSNDLLAEPRLAGTPLATLQGDFENITEAAL